MIPTKLHLSHARTFATVVAALLAISLLFMAGCTDSGDAVSESASGGSNNDSDSSAKTLNAGSTTYFYAESMDPASEWDGWYLSYYGIMENLFKVSDDLTPEPWLAESANHVGECTWKVTLRDGVTFSNGEPVDAAAVKACWERTYAENARAAETLPYDSLEADGNVLTIRTPTEMTSFENALCDPLLCVYYVGEGVDYGQCTSGTGPYAMKEFVAEDHIVMTPNEHYWNGTPKLDQVTLTCFSDENAITMALQNGEIQAIAMPSASTLATLAGNPDFMVDKRANSRADFIRMNLAQPLMENEAVRQALAWCVDREGYAQTINSGASTPCWGVYSATLPFGGTDGLDVTVDACNVEKAAQALEDAGITDADGDGVRELDGTPLELELYVCASHDRLVKLADDLLGKAASAGVKLNVHVTDYYFEDAQTFATDKPDLVLDSAAMAPTGNQAYFANTNFKSGASGNLGHYSNPQVDALIDQLDQVFDEQERNELARQIAQHVLDDAPFVFFANTESVVIAADGVSGLDASPSEYYFVTVDTDVA